VKARIVGVLAKHCHPTISLLVGPHGIYRDILFNEPQFRPELLEALRDDLSLFTRRQIAIIFADTNEAGEEIVRHSDGSKRSVFPPARDVTIQRLIKGACLEPVYGRFTSRQITHQLLPYALSRPRSQYRYQDLREDLLDLWIPAL